MRSVRTSDAHLAGPSVLRERLTTLLDGHHFDRFVEESLCDRLLAPPVMRRPSWHPGATSACMLAATSNRRQAGTGGNARVHAGESWEAAPLSRVAIGRAVVAGRRASPSMRSVMAFTESSSPLSNA